MKIKIHILIASQYHICMCIYIFEYFSVFSLQKISRSGILEQRVCNL